MKQLLSINDIFHDCSRVSALSFQCLVPVSVEGSNLRLIVISIAQRACMMYLLEKQRWGEFTLKGLCTWGCQVNGFTGIKSELVFTFNSK